MEFSILWYISVICDIAVISCSVINLSDFLANGYYDVVVAAFGIGISVITFVISMILWYRTKLDIVFLTLFCNVVCAVLFFVQFGINDFFVGVFVCVFSAINFVIHGIGFCGFSLLPNSAE